MYLECSCIGPKMAAGTENPLIITKPVESTRKPAHHITHPFVSDAENTKNILKLLIQKPLFIFLECTKKSSRRSLSFCCPHVLCDNAHLCSRESYISEKVKILEKMFFHRPSSIKIASQIRFRVKLKFACCNMQCKR